MQCSHASKYECAHCDQLRCLGCDAALEIPLMGCEVKSIAKTCGPCAAQGEHSFWCASCGHMKRLHAPEGCEFIPHKCWCTNFVPQGPHTGKTVRVREAGKVVVRYTEDI